MTTDLQKVTSAFIELFHLQDDNALTNNRPDGRLVKDVDLFTMRDGLYQTLDRLDGTMGDGFRLADVTTYLGREGLPSLVRFYPAFDFVYDPHCDNIRVTVNYDRVYPTLTDDLLADDTAVQAIQSEYNLPPFSDPASLRISGAHYLPGSALVLGIEDLHDMIDSTRLLVGVVDALLRSRAQVIVLSEAVGGPAVYDMAYLHEVWPVLHEFFISEQMLERLEEEVNNPSGAVYSIVPDTLRKLQQEIPIDVRKGLTPENMVAAMQRYPVLAEAIQVVDKQSYLKLLYGDRVTILNPDSDVPLDTVSIVDSPMFIIPAPRDGAMFSAGALMRYPVSHRPRLSCHNFQSMLMVGLTADLADDAMQVIDGRSAQWAGNLLSLEGDYLRESCLAPTDIASPAVFILFGGGAHMPGVASRLEGTASMLFVRPRVLDAKYDALRRSAGAQDL